MNEEKVLDDFRARVTVALVEAYASMEDAGAAQVDIDRLHERLTVNVTMLAACMHREYREQEDNFLALAKQAWTWSNVPIDGETTLQ